MGVKGGDYDPLPPLVTSLKIESDLQPQHEIVKDILHVIDVQPLQNLIFGNGLESVLFLVANRLLFYYNISEVVYNKTWNCPWHDFKSFSLCDISLKFLTTMIPWGNTNCCAYVRLKHAFHTLKTFQPLSTRKDMIITTHSGIRESKINLINASNFPPNNYAGQNGSLSSQICFPLNVMLF